MSRNSHNPSIDESPKSWSDEFNRTGKNAHGQTWEEIFGTPAEPALDQSDAVERAIIEQRKHKLA